MEEREDGCSPIDKRAERLDPWIERLLLLSLEALQAESLERAPRIEVATAPAQERAVIR